MTDGGKIFVASKVKLQRFLQRNKLTQYRTMAQKDQDLTNTLARL